MQPTQTIYDPMVRLRRKPRRRSVTTILFTFLLAALSSYTARASIVEFSGGQANTTPDSEIFFSPNTGKVSTSYFSNALFGVGNVSGDQAIAFNSTGDGSFVVSQDSASLLSVTRLGPGVSIGSDSAFDNTELTLAENDGAIGNWNQLGSGFLGLEFGSGKDVHYGWADITVGPDYNITLDSFAYETVAGEAIVTPAGVAPEPASALLIGFAGLSTVLFGAIRRPKRSLIAVVAAIPLLFVSAGNKASAQNVPGQADPAAGRLMQFRIDQLFNISAAASGGQTNWSTLNTNIADSPFSAAVQDTSHSTTTGWYAGRQYHAASGRLLTPDHDDVVVVNGDGTNVDVQVVGHPELNIKLPGLLSRYVQTLADGSTHPSVDWLSVAVGDLDGDVDTSGNYHDEVVVGYVMTDGTYRVVVLDFSNSVINPETNQLQTFPPAFFNFDAMNGVKYSPAIMVGPEPCQCASVLPDDNLISVSVGNFDGGTDGEIAVTAVTGSTGETVQTLRYRHELGRILPISTQKMSSPEAVPGLKSAMGADVDSAVGDFEGRGASDLAVASMQWTFVPNGQSIVFVGHSVSILKSSLQSANISNVSVYPGNPTTLWFSDDPTVLSQVPKQLIISGATGKWTRLNGTWPTTMALISPDGVGHVGIQIPVDTEDLTSSEEGGAAISLTMGLSTGLTATPNTPLIRVPFETPTPTVSFVHPESYPHMRLFSGLFKYDPAHGFDFSRRQLGVVWNATEGTLGISWFSVADDSVGNPQATQDGTQTINAPGIQHSFAATAGAFRSSALQLSSDRNASGPATWPIMINAWYGNSQQTLYAVDAGASGDAVTVQSGSTSQPYDPQERFSLVNYDADGKSTYLGAPVHISASALYTPTLILEEPPKHTAWLNGAIVNYSRNDSLNVQFQSNRGEELTGSTQSQSSNTTTSLTTISAGLSLNSQFPFGIGDKISLQDTYKLGSDVENTSSYYNSNSSTISYSQMAETDHDDFLRGQTQDLNIWRYRVYGANGDSTTGNLYYDMALPSAPYDSSASGLDLDWYNPIHENGNLLSYPSRPSNGLPDDVGGGYTVNNQAPPNASNGVLFANTGWCYGDDSGTETITMSGVTSSSDTLGWTKTNSWDSDMQISDTLSMEGIKATGTYDSDWGQKQSLSATASSANTMSGSASVTLNLGNGDATQDYNIFPVLYSSNAGVLKLIHFVNIPTAASHGSCITSGEPFWTKYYSGAPDPALNLPYRLMFAGYNKSTTTTTWNPQADLIREKLRGLFVTSATPNPIESTDDNPVYDPVSINPTVGSTVRLAVRVYNYSVNQATGNINVNFWAVPYDSSRNNELACGTPGSIETGRHCAPNVRALLGTTPITSIPAWGGQNWTLAALNWTIPSDFITRFNTPEFRIYVTLDYAGPSLNPAQAPCNNSPANAPLPCPASMITDPADPKYDPLALGQNKEGYGQITLEANTLKSVSRGGAPTYTKVHGVEDSLAAVGTDGKLTNNFVVAYLGRPLRLRVKAVADNADDPSLQKALVFEGSGKNRTLIAGKTMQGVSTQGTQAWFDWTPTSLGLHQLSAQFLGPNIDKQPENTTAKLSVVVVRLPGDVNGDGIVDARDTEIISREIGKTVKESSCGSACDLNGNGVIDRGDLDLAMAHCDRNYCAAIPVIQGNAIASLGKEVKK